MMYLVVDTVSGNVLAECESFTAAKAAFLDLVAMHPEAATELRILSETGKQKSVPHEEVVARLEEAVAG
jgi:hypothetical protein